jgi:hypothetical protein
MGLVSEGQDMRVGVKGASNQNVPGLDGDSWVIFDNFQLVWIGYEASVIQPLLEEQVAKFSDMKDLAESTDVENAKYMSKTAFETIEAKLLAAQNAIDAADGQAMFTVLGELLALDAEIAASVAKFGTLVTANQNLADAIGEYSDATDAAIENATTLNANIAALLPAHSIEDADVDAKIAEITAAIAALRVPKADPDASDENPQDMTVALANPTYDEDNEGWSGTAAARNGDAGNAELFNKSYNYYQELRGLAPGTYQIKVQGFYRHGEVAEDYMSVENPLASKAFVYGMIINGEDSVYSTKPLIRLAAECTDWSDEKDLEGYAVCATDTIIDTDYDPADTTVIYKHVVNTQTAAGSVFDEGQYAENTVIVKVPENGYLRLGLIKNDEMKNDWTCFDNWELWYFGKNSAKDADADELATGISNLNKVELNGTIYNLNGQKVEKAHKGLFIINGKKVVVK